MSMIFMKWLGYASKRKMKSQWKELELQKTIKAIEAYCSKMLTRSFLCLKGFSRLAKEKRLLRNMIANRRDDHTKKITFRSWARFRGEQNFYELMLKTFFPRNKIEAKITVRESH